ncbi:hypothetical protein Q4489_07545 [Thalassotalea sp. 1_MG-2023]|uniref:hypothetical protein n=1 Tax=Thalassotalea sp. 1_MG-2023 TaxID=3062680 RepID=UPI0026E1CF3F|nr:hypothetical protein [Thalassotalea sp. 1_MG-2023]MDO6426858.1 hypothetical protein [Thalassotalea sp. 1_MG-2023]
MSFGQVSKYLTFCISIALSLPVKANVCDVSTLDNYIDKIEFLPANTMCGSQMSMLLISFKKEGGIKQNKLQGISLDVRSLNNSSITRYSLKHSKSTKNKVALTCLNKAYINNSILIFTVSQMKKTKASNSNKLSLKSRKLECKLKSLILNT